MMREKVRGAARLRETLLGRDSFSPPGPAKSKFAAELVTVDSDKGTQGEGSKGAADKEEAGTRPWSATLIPHHER